MVFWLHTMISQLTRRMTVGPVGGRQDNYGDDDRRSFICVAAMLPKLDANRGGSSRSNR
jgi:hypothetical protein